MCDFTPGTYHCLVIITFLTEIMTKIYNDYILLNHRLIVFLLNCYELIAIVIKGFFLKPDNVFHAFSLQVNEWMNEDES